MSIQYRNSHCGDQNALRRIYTTSEISVRASDSELGRNQTSELMLCVYTDPSLCLRFLSRTSVSEEIATCSDFLRRGPGNLTWNLCSYLGQPWRHPDIAYPHNWTFVMGIFPKGPVMQICNVSFVAEQTVKLSVIAGVMMLMWHHCNAYYCSYLVRYGRCHWRGVPHYGVPKWRVGHWGEAKVAVWRATSLKAFGSRGMILVSPTCPEWRVVAGPRTGSQSAAAELDLGSKRWDIFSDKWLWWQVYFIWSNDNKTVTSIEAHACVFFYTQTNKLILA